MIAPATIADIAAIAGGVSFSPADISGLKLWLKADAITGLNDGDPVTTWNDSSGQGNNATQATAAKKPTYQTNELNGKPIVRFDGTDDFLATASNFLGAGNPPTTIFIAGKITTLTSGPAWINIGANPRAANLDEYRTMVESDGSIYQSNIVNDRATANGTITTGVWNIITYRIAAGAFSSSNPEFYKNGTSQASTEGTGVSTPNLGTGATHIGANNEAVPGQFLDGDLTEIIVYDSALSTANRQSVENYLNGRYAIF